MARVLLALVLIVATGCGILTKPAERISVERQQFLNSYARARVLYQHLHARIEALCQVDRLNRETCAKAAAIDQQARALDAEIRAKIDTPESEVDWPRVMQLLEFALGLVL